MKLLIGTSQGLMLWKDGFLSQLLSGWVYGISKLKNTWYCSRIHNGSGSIVELTMIDDKVIHARPVVECNVGVHQIDFIDNQLVFADTPGNRIVIYPSLKADPIYLYPNGHTDAVGPVPESLHLNSVFAQDGKLYVMAHNFSSHFNRDSEMYIYEFPSLKLLECRKLLGRDCHNIFIQDGKVGYLDSRAGQIYLGDKVINEMNGFLRGLSIIDNYCIFGANATAKREERERKGGALIIADRKFNKIQEIPMDAPICEVRCIDQPDYGMSNTSR